MWVIFLRPGARCSSVAMTFLTFRGYKLADGDAWEHNVRIDLRPNPDYHGNGMPRNKGLRFEFYASLKQLHLAGMGLTMRVERLEATTKPPLNARGLTGTH
jgi:hypothetical protein